jgi:outer membrane cobalamin receptor
LAEEIEKFGANSLWEILERFPSVQNIFSPGINRTAIRGAVGEVSHLHTLLMIDGRPLRTSGGNNSIYNAFDSFPVEMIARIEIIRGPGSVLYGTNAFEGVINIITKTPSEKSGTVKLMAGSDSTKSGQVFFGLDQADFNLDLGAYYYDTDGWRFETVAPGPPFTFSEFVSRDTFADTLGIDLKMGYRNFSLFSYVGRMKQFTEPFVAPDGNFRSNVSLIDLGYEKDVSDNWRIEAHVTNNRERFNWQSGPVPALTFDTDDTLVEVTAYGKIKDNVKILFGGSIQKLTGTGSGYDDFDFQAYSAYSQISYRPNRFLKLIVGGQWNRVEDVDSDTVPRLGAIFSFSPRTGLKALYSGAFRSPTFPELTANNPGIQIGNPLLQSEEINTVDLQYFFHGEKKEFSVTYYRSKESNLIRVVPVPGLQLGEYQNQGELNLEGLEVEGKFVPSNHLYISGTASYQENDDETGAEDVTLAPSFTAKVGIGYATEIFSVGLFNSHFDEYQPRTNFFPVNPPADAVNLLSCNVSVHVGKFTGLKDFTVEAYGVNLLDEEIYVPDILNNFFNSLPGGGGRSLYGAVKMKF